MNPHELAARERKAAKLVTAIDMATMGRGENPTTSADRLLRKLECWSAADWARLAKVAGTRIPSEETRSHVIAAFRLRADAVARLGVAS